jgi:non-heme chloroperoxidase
MPTITTKDGTQIFYKDWGKGQPVVFSHGWPLNADAWDDQLYLFATNGYRAIEPSAGQKQCWWTRCRPAC